MSCPSDPQDDPRPAPLGELDLDDVRVHRALRDATIRTLSHNIGYVRGWFFELLEQRYGREGFASVAKLDLDEDTLRAWFEDWVQRTIASDERFGRRWLAEMMETEAGRAAQALATRDKVAFGDWTRAFALGGRSEGGGHLPPPAQHVDGLGHADLPRGVETRAELLERVVADTAPLPDTAQREGYHGPRHFDFWMSGLEDYLAIESVLARHDAPLAAGARVLEMGCASGRVLRHFLFQRDDLEVWGCDINGGHVDWLGQHLPERTRIFQNTVLPSLPIPDASLDLVYAFSVFTHIDEFERSWIAELARVLAPGGFAYLTVHTEHTWSIVERAGALMSDLVRMRDQISDYDVGPELFAGPLPKDRTVFRWTSALSNNTSVFYSTRHIRRAWGTFLEIVEIIPEGAGYQDVVVLRKR
ncbi:hypothetical protein Pla163_16370 [Planctomycetes bacterium Pla163]|uniref:Methyltransferase type 11 domain-containing protein n=1 Tax=Rohdeia mirabilis TaxID=2528008 RepID=A0A518CZ75_9BACT|nr:hypothetical protein Pla163_16370 [Planctomycetes bacterium Pla163]